ncbi:protein-disulfide reductase DsbD family protein [Methylobacterium isbiliense]|uniref:Thiol:disulfide interchange protein DsbD n=1 Tax=Methylobacterium isbiliense TaxID=315478 RepID=A0ABQ4SFN6_9HYPH|nr:protein-disulfide reductase DsbD domain-containing protein [Methylobacterium isbiliense]MDN3627388.1 protein-disulfide reductase DsbD family protein [Methylobacterium isbiliense]GJE02037.1 Thiol:disulfide interchange protein DsbD [Methylobacterium isbiliense]
MRKLTWLVAILATYLAGSSPGVAQLGSPPARPDIKVDLLIGEYDPLEPQTVWLGVRVRLGSGWKTYWRSPGDSGLPPEFDWSMSTNLEQAEPLWPAPHRMELLGVETIGYKDEVVFPIKARVPDPNAPIQVSLKLGLYACTTICVRDDHAMTGTIAPGDSRSGEQAIIDTWRKRVPAASSNALSISSIRLKEASPPELEVIAKATEAFEAPDLFVESDPPVFGSKPRVTISPGGTATLTVPLEAEKTEDLRNRPLRITLVDGEHAIEASTGRWATNTPAAPPSPRQTNDQGLWLMLGVALAGGFILNLMPCVFPVLSLKLLAFVNRDAGRMRRIQTGFAASAAGVIASFLALASAMVALKATGATIGWGIQFQQPIFLAVMAAVLTLFAANLLGLFEVILPARIAGALDRVGRGHSLASHFGSGFVATLLATPCSAPFVGTAVGFALSRGTGEIYLVFAALGLGMALPYLVIVAVPSLATLIPRPGRWMLVLKRIMAAGLLVTAMWLLSIVGTIAGIVSAAGLALTLAVVIVGLRLRQGASGAAKAALSLALVAVPVTVVGAVNFTGKGADPQTDAIRWRAFDEPQVKALVGEGKTVLVDITAAWCVTCKVNKALTLDDEAVKRRLASDVVPVQGDWTKPDERIAAYLQSFGRYGIPFDVVYGPGAPAGIVLPELLTTRAVLEAFDKAAARPTAVSASK